MKQTTHTAAHYNGGSFATLAAQEQMEIIGLVLAIPAVMLANVLYVLLVRFIFVRFHQI